MNFSFALGTKTVEWTCYSLSALVNSQWHITSEILLRKLQGLVQAVSGVSTDLQAKRERKKYILTYSNYGK